MSHRIPAAVLVFLATTANAGNCDFSAVGARAQQLMQTANLADIGVAIGTQRGVLYKQFYGSDAWNDATRVPLASASKMLAGVRIMQLADRGAIDLDAPVSTYLPEFTGSKGSMTMREMFSHTSGYGNDLDSPVLAFPITLAQDVAYIARYVDPPYPPPGAYFAYGGISMQVGGEVAEVQGGGNWESGWIEHVGVPLGITSIDWQGLGPTLNYRISGGAQASLADYSKVLAMLAGGGVGNGQRILSPLAIRTMNHDQTNGALLAYSPPGADGSHDYGIGAWIEAFSQTIDEPTISSIGKFGYTPWVDFGSGYWGVLMVHEEQARVPTMGERAHAALQDISAIVRPALDPSCALIETYDAIFHDGAEPPP